MKVGVLFWGFNDLNFISECSKILKEKQDLKEFYVQISSNEKTISLLDVFPEEIIRAECDDLNLFYKWLAKNHKKNIIIVLNIWMLLNKKNFPQILKNLKEILSEPFQFIICTPKNTQEIILFPESKKLSYIAEKSFDFFRNVNDFYDLALNSENPVMLLAHSPHLNLLNAAAREEIFTIKKIGLFNFLPAILNDFSSIFVTNKNLITAIENNVEHISKQLQVVKNKKELDLEFFNFIKADYENPNSKFTFNKKKLKGFLIISSLEYCFNFKNKEDIRFLNWLIYLAIIEKHFHSVLVEDSSKESLTSLELFSSTSM